MDCEGSCVMPEMRRLDREFREGAVLKPPNDRYQRTGDYWRPDGVQLPLTGTATRPIVVA